MKMFKGKGEFTAAVRGYVALGGSRGDQDTFRLDVIGAALYHGLAHANFDPGMRVAKATLGAIRPDVERAMAECRKAWEANGKSNLDDKEAQEKAQELLRPVQEALTELRAEQDRNKEEKKQAKEAAARAEQIAKRETEGESVPSPFILKGPDGGLELTESEFATLMGTLTEIRKGLQAVTVDLQEAA